MSAQPCAVEGALPTVPGLHPQRLVALMHAAIDACALDLRGLAVLTEAATGAYVVTPVLAALAGAGHVHAVARATRHGSVEQVRAGTLALARLAGVAHRIEIAADKTPQALARADIVTNSGHVRPLDARTIGLMKPGAVIPLMYERWELREADLDLAAARARGIRVVGTNERHPAVDVFSYLGLMAAKLLMDAGVAVLHSRVLVLCDNPFEPYIARGLSAAGATVDSTARLDDARASAGYDAILVALQPGAQPVLSRDAIGLAAQRWPGAVVAVYWGDVDRGLLREAGLPAWPAEAPGAGHMGILPSGIGPEPIVRLQAGSLKAAEALLRHGADSAHAAHAFAQPL